MDDLLQSILFLLELVIFARVLVSWVARGKMGHPIIVIIFQITEPILKPIRRILPGTGTLDFSPIVAIILLNIISYVVRSVI